jgi:small-conductance mechanosensitive channel
MSKQKLKAISSKLKKASKAHAGQAKQIDNMIKNKKSTFKVMLPDSRVTVKKKGTSKSIGPQESSEAIKAKRQKMRSAKPFSKEEEKASAELRKAKSFVKMRSALKKKTSPALAKLSASCKAAAKRKFKVYPSAYANMWASKTQKAGKC